MSRIALKIDVDTHRGALVGVPRLIESLRRHAAGATFFFTVGPDHTGRALGSAWRRGRLGHYGAKTLMHGTLLPGPEIGHVCKDILIATRAAGFEVGMRAWNATRWCQRIQHATYDWVQDDMARAIARFTEVLGSPPRAHAAPDWQMDVHALRLTQRLGFVYASDCRGARPFVPMRNGEIILCPQIPTTLPTVEELLAIAGADEESVHQRLLDAAEAPGDHVFSLCAELEGIKLLSILDRLLDDWQARGHKFAPLGEIAGELNIATLPRHEMTRGEVSGRRDTLMLQGEQFLENWREPA